MGLELYLSNITQFRMNIYFLAVFLLFQCYSAINVIVGNHENKGTYEDED